MIAVRMDISTTYDRNKLLEIFKNGDFFNKGILLEIIDRNIIGSIYQFRDDTFAIIERCQDPFITIIGELDDDSTAKIIELTSQIDYPMVYCEAKYQSLFLKNGWNFHLRVEFILDNHRLYQLDENFKIKSINNHEIFNNCQLYKQYLQLYNSEKNFFNYARGFVLYKSHKIVSEVYLHIGGNHAEMNIITHPDHRGKGYGKMLASDVIKQLIIENYSPEWSCNADNVASINLALQLGFKINRHYVLMVRPCGNVLCSESIKWLKNNNFDI